MNTNEVLKLALEALGAYMSATDSEEDAKAHSLMAEAFFKIKEALANEALERMAENARELGLDYDAKSDHQLMENAKGDVERIQLVQTNVGIGNPSKGNK